MKRILFVCLGNICRSPAAEGVLARRAKERDLEIFVDSAGTGGWHAGEPPDSRMIAACRRRGYDIARQRARQVEAADFVAFDYLLAMDLANQADLLALAPAGRKADIRLFLDFADTARRETPDPYYGDEAAFEDALDLIEAGAEALLDHLERNG
jgi:protein-tyrosine phosphatase